MSKEENFKLFCELRGQEVEGSVLEHEKYTINRGELTGFSQYDDDKPFQIGGHSWYRNIKPIKKPEYKPWNKKTFKFQMVEINGDIFVPVRWDDLGIYIYEGENEDCLCTLYTWEEMVKYCRTLDGQPCGEVVE